MAAERTEQVYQFGNFQVKSSTDSLTTTWSVHQRLATEGAFRNPIASGMSKAEVLAAFAQFIARAQEAYDWINQQP
jgi:hypothetical protein